MRIFGEIKGYTEGTIFESRIEIYNVEMHYHTQRGISIIGDIGSDCIILSGGYEDDEDNNLEIIYTGHGGRDPKTKKQISNQFLKAGNLVLSKNKHTRLPIRVIRKIENKKYRYDGLYSLEDFWPEERDGNRIYRFRLVKNDIVSNYNLSDNNKVERDQYQISKPKRDYLIPLELKKDYDYKCQVCGIRLETNGEPHAVGGHIRPRGRPHNGDDNKNNMIVLCPNDHLLFDEYGFTIDDDFKLIGREGKLNVIPDHEINKENLRYHRNKYFLSLK